MGDFDPLLENPPPVRLYRVRLLGAAVDPSADLASFLASAVRARMARTRRVWRLTDDGSPRRVIEAARCPTFPSCSNRRRPTDAEAILRLNERVFGPGRFARTAYRVRETAAADLSLSFVARVGTLLVGANAMTPIVIGETPALLLGPLIVEPVFRSQGIGEALVTASLEAAQRRRAEAGRPGRRRALLRAHGLQAASRPAGSRCRVRSTRRACSIANLSPARWRRRRASCTAPDPGGLFKNILS